MILAWANMQELMTFAFALTFTCLITALGLATFFHKRSRAVAGENLVLRDHLIGLQDRLDQFDEQQNAEFPTVFYYGLFMKCGRRSTRSRVPSAW